MKYRVFSTDDNDLLVEQPHVIEAINALAVWVEEGQHRGLEADEINMWWREATITSEDYSIAMINEDGEWKTFIVAIGS